MSLLRLLRFIRGLNVPKSSVITKIYSENALLGARQMVFLTNDGKHYATVTIREIQDIKEGNSLDQKIDILNKTLYEQGRISYFDLLNLLDHAKNHESITSLQGLFILRCCTELIDGSSLISNQILADKLWNMLREVGMPLDISHYNTLLLIYLESDRDFLPEKFLEEMRSENIKPNRVTFERLILQYCKKGDTQKANDILDFMKAFNDEQISENFITENILSSFILSYFKNNDKNTALETMKTMESLNITPTIKTYSVLMNSYAEIGDIESIKKILAECESKNINVSDKELLNIIYYFTINGFTEHVDEILSLITTGGHYAKNANKIVFKLIGKQKDDVAFKIMKTIPKTVSLKNLADKNSFIETLINCNMPIHKYIEIIQEKELNDIDLYHIIKKCYENAMYEKSISIMKAWQDLGGLIKETNFYPILRAYCQAEQFENIEKLLYEICIEFKMQPSTYLLKTYILPYLNTKNTQEILSLLLNCQIPVNIATNVILLHLLTENKIRESVKFMSVNYERYKMEDFKSSLLQAFKNTEDIPSFVWILHYMYMATINNSFYTQDEIFKIDSIYLAQQCVDSSIEEIIDFISTKKYLSTMLFSNLVDKGLTLSPETVKNIKQKLGDFQTVTKNLNLLESGDLRPKSINKIFTSYWSRKLSDIRKLGEMANKLPKIRDQLNLTVKRQLFTYYCSIFKENEAMELLEEFQENRVSIPPVFYMFLVDMYIHLQKLDKVEFWLQEIKEMYPDCLHTKVRILSITELHIKDGQLEKARSTLTWPFEKTKYDSQIPKLVSSILTELLSYNDENLLHEFLRTLIRRYYIQEIKAEIFEPFIEFYLNKNDLQAALRKFYWILKNYRVVPSVIELLKKCIIDKDEKSLNLLTITHKQCVGNNSALFDLGIAYIESKRKDDAYNLFKNKSLQIEKDDMIYFAEKYYSNNDAENMEMLFDVFNRLNYDVKNLSLLLLKIYYKKSDWRKCSDLWTTMQVNGIKPSSMFMNYLQLVFQQKNVENCEALSDFKRALTCSEPIKAEELLDSIPLDHKSDCYAALCKKYLQTFKYSKIVDLWRDLTERFDLDFDLYTAETILSTLFDQNEVIYIVEIGEFLNPTYKSEVNYSYYLNETSLKAGCWNLYLKYLEETLNNDVINDSDINMCDVAVLKSLTKHPYLCEQFDELARKFVKKGIHRPMQLLWIYYFEQGNVKAKEIFEEYIRHSKLPFWERIFKSSKCEKNPEFCVQLAQILQQSSVSLNKKRRLYTKLIESCIKSNGLKKYESALKCLQYSLADCSLNDFNVDLLANLQTELEECGIPWPWTTRKNKTY